MKPRGLNLWHMNPWIIDVSAKPRYVREVKAIYFYLPIYPSSHIIYILGIWGIEERKRKDDHWLDNKNWSCVICKGTSLN